MVRNQTWAVLLVTSHRCPLLFITCINYLDTGISSDVSKFFDDAKVGRVIESDQEDVVLQDELNRLCDWAEKVASAVQYRVGQYCEYRQK